MDSIQPEVIHQSLHKGIQYLHQHQLPNGEFCLYIGQEDDLKHTIPYSNIFSTSLISYSLLKLSHLTEVQEVLERSAAFLQYQAMRGGVWNNFTSWSPLFKVCPADIDNTACASKVLQALKKDYPDNRDLMYNNLSYKGLFYTWYTLRPNTVWRKDYWLLILREFKNPLKSLFFWSKFECNRNDIDGVVNANALFYLGLNERTDPIVNYIIDIIIQNKEEDCDLWYRNAFTIYYFFSRNYANGITRLEAARQLMIDRIFDKANEDGSFGTGILDTALGVISLINLNCKSSLLTKAIHYITDNQTAYGNWIRWAVYYGGPKKLSCFGSEELTTGFCLEALSLYKSTLNNENI